MFKTEMSNMLGNICRVCLKVAEKEFEIDETVNQMFEILLIKLDLSITRHPIICQHCMEVGEKCLSFKCTCIDTEKIILSYSAYKKKVKHNIKVIYEERNCRRIVFDDVNICRICMTLLERNNFLFDSLLNESTFEMLSKYMVEMDFNTIENPIICAVCRENLHAYFKFVLNCVDIEEKIKTHCIEKGTDRTDEVSLGDVLQFVLTDDLEYPDKYSQTRKIKQDRYPEAYSGLTKQEELYIKNEGTILNEDSYRNTSEPQLYKNGNKFLSTKYNNETKSNIIWLKTKEQDTEGHESSNMRTDKHAACTDETNETENIKMVIQMETQDFESNVSVDRDAFPMHNSSLCAYESKYKSNFKTHMLVHKDASEINMFKCSLCTYESKHKANVKHHMLVHKDISEKDLHKCSLCSFESKHKRSLDLHMLVHKDVSEIKMSKCSLCTFESKHRGSLKYHMLLHKDISEIKIFKCLLCGWESKRKGNHKRHMMIHKDVSEIKLFKCSLCAYKFKQKSNLKKHMLVHKDVSEINMFKCSLCAYECKYKSGLKHHMVVHTDVSETKMFKCSLCGFKSKHKGNLNKHMILHKDVSEINMFKCKFCSYESKRKGNLTRHILIHKDVSEVENFKGKLCPYESKQKPDVEKHVHSSGPLGNEYV